MRLKRAFPVLVLFSTLWCNGCLQKTVRTVHPNLSDGKYDNEFPYGNASGGIASVVKSVHKIFSVVYFTTYQFELAARVTKSDLRSGRFRKMALGTIGTHESTSGTATVIMNNDHRVALLTCAHVLESPDTLVSFYPISSVDPVEYVKSISIREKQELYIKELASCGAFTILASDHENDIAIVGKKCEANIDSVRIFGYPSGSAKELSWGSLVYIFGYPMGNLMVTRGIVSSPDGSPSGSFTVDALLNKGYSGGLILAIRDGIPNFELVGMVKSISSDQEYYLKPEKERYEFHYNSFVPYTGGIYTGIEERINYGINFIIPIETMAAFYRKNRTSLVSQGYNLDAFFTPPEK